jgi:hypothetical protein
MHEKIVDIWTNALKSGEYKQGYARLHSLDHKFCCLGVLTDLYIKGHPSIQWEHNTPLNQYYSYKRVAGSLHPDVMDWAGIKTCWGKLNIGTLSSLNDTGHDFKYIADIIRRHWTEL